MKKKKKKMTTTMIMVMMMMMMTMMTPMEKETSYLWQLLVSVSVSAQNGVVALGIEGCGFPGFQVFTGLRCSQFEKPVRSKKKPKNRFLQGT